MMDTRTVLDNVRHGIPGNAKLLVVWIAPDGGPMHAAQANLNQKDVLDFANGLIASATSQKLLSAKG